MRTTSWAMGLLAGALALTGAAGCATSNRSTVKTNETAAGYTERGATGSMQGSVPELTQRAEKILHDQGLTIASSMTGGTGYSRILEGVKGDQSVRISVTRETPEFSRVEILALKNPHEADNGLARKMLRDMARG